MNLVGARIAYRATVYASRQVDFAENTVLTPAAGAVHSDPFKIATLPGVSGFKPYLGVPSIKRGEIDPLTTHTTIDQGSIQVLDVRTNANRTNLERWCTAFLGDVGGFDQLLGNKVYLEECLDLVVDAQGNYVSGTFNPFFVGRIEAESLDSPVWMGFQLMGLAADLNTDCFATRPSASVSYAVEPIVLPVGLSAAYADQVAASPLTGTVAAASYSSTPYRILTLDSASQGRDDNLLTAALLQQFAGAIQAIGNGTTLTAGVGIRLPPGALRCRFSCASPAISNKELSVMALFCTKRTDGHYAVAKIGVQALTNLKTGGALTDDLYYQAFDTGTVADGTSLTGITLRLITMPDSLTPYQVLPRTKGVTLTREAAVSVESGGATYLIAETPLMTFLGDLVAGKFSALFQPVELGGTLPASSGTPPVVGDPKYPIAYDTSGGSKWDALANPSSAKDALPSVRMIIPEKMKRFDFIEKHLGQPFGIAYRFRAALQGGIPVSLFEPVDLRIPSAAALGSPVTITDADLATSQAPQWTKTRDSAVSDVQVGWYTDTISNATTLSQSKDTIPAIQPSLINAVKNVDNIAISSTVRLGSKPLAIDAIGIRGLTSPTDTVEGRASVAKALAQASKVARRYQIMFANGLTTITIRVFRTANTSALYQGDWCYLGASMIPSPGTNKRGETRLCLVTGRSESGLYIDLTLVDAGNGAACSSPTIGTPTQTAGNTSHGISVAITLNASSEPVEVEVAIKPTSYGTTPPGNNDTAWQFGVLARTSATYLVDNLPSGTRAFVRARSLPLPQATPLPLKLPSAWVTPSGTKYVDTAARAQPGTITITPGTILATSTIVASWTNTEADLRLTGTLDGVALDILQPGTLSLDLTALSVLSSHTYTLLLWYVDELGGVGPSRSQTYTTPVSYTGPGLSAPTLGFA